MNTSIVFHTSTPTPIPGRESFRLSGMSTYFAYVIPVCRRPSNAWHSHCYEPITYVGEVQVEYSLLADEAALVERNSPLQSPVKGLDDFLAT